MPVLYSSIDTLSLQNTTGYPHYAATGQIDLAMLASKMYGKNIRQGNSFYLKKVTAQLVGRNQGVLEDFDTGGACTLQLKFYQTNKYNRAAWNAVFKQWSAQKRLGGAIGGAIKNDDMEFAWNQGMIVPGRTSNIYQSMSDGTPEKLVLDGASTAGTDFALKDFCNTSMFPVQEPSKDHFDDSVYKENKFDDNRFGIPFQMEMGMSNSSIVTDVGGLDISGIQVTPGRALSGAMVTVGEYEFPRPTPVLCGLMSYNVLINPPDTVTQSEDDFFIRIQYHIAKWKPLVYRPKKSLNTYKKGMSKFTRSRRSSGRRRRR